MTKRLFSLQPWGSLFLFLAVLSGVLPAQQVTLTGLLSQGGKGQFNAVRTDAAGNVYVLLDQKDGVRVLKLNPAATQVLAQVQVGGAGDAGLAMALDPAGNVYVAGTSTGSLSGTSGAAFPARADASTNSFVAKFNSSLTTQWVTFCGGGRMAAAAIAATADAVFVTGSSFAPTVPVTGGGIQQTPAPGSNTSGFVERFSSSGSTLVYATYLTGANGNTVPAAIAADISDNAYVAGSTSAAGYPTVSALVPQMLLAGDATASGFVSKLLPAGDGFSFSTFVPGTGITSAEISGSSLLLAGGVALGQFPVMTVAGPLARTNYQAVMQMPLDGSSVSQSTLLAPGTQAFATAGSSGDLWAAASVSTPLLPVPAAGEMGQSALFHLAANGVVDRVVRSGGLPSTAVTLAKAPVMLNGVARTASGDVVAAGGFAPSTSGSLVTTQRYDLPLVAAPNASLPAIVRDAAPSVSCGGSACAGSAGFLVSANTSNYPALAWSVDNLPNLTLRNLGTTDATGLVMTASGYSLATNCASTLTAGQSCAILLTGSGPGSVTASTVNARTATASLPANTVTGNPIVVSTRELDFGMVAAESPVDRTFTVTNLGGTTVTSTSALQIVSNSASVFAEQSSTCPTQGAASTKLLAAGSSCSITLRFTAASSAANNGAAQNVWSIGGNEVLLTAYSQAAALDVSASQVDFGLQFAGGLTLPRYLYLSNNSAQAQSHVPMELPANSAFQLADRCPIELLPHSVCQIEIQYNAASAPSADAVTLSLDNGIQVLITGTTKPQPSVNGSVANPNLQLTPSAVTFPDPVVVTAVSPGSQQVTLTNTGTSSFALQIGLSGDFQQTTNCGANLAAGASCAVNLQFAPTQPGTRNGLLTVTAGNFAPSYVTLTATATALFPSTNGVLDFGAVPLGQPTVQWYKMAQSITRMQVDVTGDFAAIVVEDAGYGHGSPARSQFQKSTVGSCLNCWLGVQFQPTATGSQSATMAISSPSAGGGTQTLTLAGHGIPLSGAVLTPVERDFGAVTLGSSSQAAEFLLTNAGDGGSNAAIAVGAPVLSGDFAPGANVSGGTACGGSLAYGESCAVAVVFTPSATGIRGGTLSITAGSGVVSSTLTGFGAPSSGIGLTPDALVFQNVPGTTATQQNITVKNISGVTASIGTPTAGSSQFAVNSTCGMLAANTSCTLGVTFTPGNATVQTTLTIPVSFASGVIPATTLSIALNGSYTADNATLQIVPGETVFPSAASGAVGVQRHFTLNNLTAKPYTVRLSLPRQFALGANGCSGLAPAASCGFDVLFTPQTNGDVTGTILAEAVPADNTATRTGLGYVEGYATGSGTIAIQGTGAGNVVDFGQVASGQNSVKTLTLTNTGTVDVNVRRIRSDWPFLATTTCGGRLAVAATCTVTVSYTPLNQVGTTSSIGYRQDQATLTIESDALSSPDVVDLTGQAQAVGVTSPVNTAPLAVYSISAGSLSFATTRAGEISPVQSLNLSNTGTQTVHITGLIAPQEYTITNGCVAALLPGAGCRIDVAFTPQSAATRPVALEIQSDAVNNLEFVTLFATGTASSVALSPAALDFGKVNLGNSTVLPVQISNTGSTAVTLNSITATTAEYTVAGDCPTAGSSFAAGAACTAQVSFRPSQTGTRVATLNVSTSATSLPLQVSLSGVGIQSRLVISPASLAFGALTVGASARQTITLTNAGTGMVTSFAAVASSADFAVITPCPATLNPGDVCQMTVQFTPGAVGAQTASLRLTGSDPALPTAVPLTGTGVVPGSFTLTATNPSATVVSGKPASYTLTLTPLNGFSGTVALTCAAVQEAQYANCSLLPSTLAVVGTSAQTSVVTINTITSVASARMVPKRITWLALGVPLGLLFIRRRRLVGMTLCFVFVATLQGCGGGAKVDTSLRYTPAGTYSYRVTATSTSGVQMSQTVTLTLTVTP